MRPSRNLPFRAQSSPPPRETRTDCKHTLVDGNQSANKRNKKMPQKHIHSMKGGAVYIYKHGHRRLLGDEARKRVLVLQLRWNKAAKHLADLLLASATHAQESGKPALSRLKTKHLTRPPQRRQTKVGKRSRKGPHRSTRPPVGSAGRQRGAI